MAKAGCLFFLAIIGLLCVELYVLLVVIQRFQDVPMPIAAIVALSIIGYKLMQYHKNHLMTAFMQNNAGKRIIGMLGAILLIIPGFITGALGLLLQIPVFQSLFGRLGNVLMASIMKRAMSGGLGKGFPGGGFPPGGFPPGGFPGGAFPGGPAGMFPGGFPQPDDSVNISKSVPKTYDVKPDKD